MTEYPRIEEPPPIHRRPPESPRSSMSGLIAWSQRLAPKRRTAAGGAEAVTPMGRTARPGPEHGHTSTDGSRGRDAKLLLAAAVLFVMMIAQGWTIHRVGTVRGDLAATEVELGEARASLAQLWDVTELLGAEQIARLAELTDSIRAVLEYAKGEARLWNVVHTTQDQRLEASEGRLAQHGGSIAQLTIASRRADARLAELGRTGEIQGARLASLEQSARTQTTALDALARRVQAQESDVRAMTATLATLRDGFAGLDTELAGLARELAATGSRYGELGVRIERLNGWIEGFRQAGLSGEAVDRRLAALTSELRQVRLRVDSLRAATPARPTTRGMN